MPITDQKLTLKKFENLSQTAQDLFHFKESFGRLHKLKNSVCVLMFEDPIQKTETSTGGPFQVYLLDNIFITGKTVRYENTKNLQKTTIETLINEKFTLGRDENKKTNTRIH